MSLFYKPFITQSKKQFIELQNKNQYLDGPRFDVLSSSVVLGTPATITFLFLTSRRTFSMLRIFNAMATFSPTINAVGINFINAK